MHDEFGISEINVKELNLKLKLICNKKKCILLPSVVIHTYIYSIRTTRVLIYQELHKITKQGKYDKFNVTVHLHI